MDQFGQLIVFEGADGAGKTTISKNVAEVLFARGRRCEWHAFPGRLPGTLGALVYRLHHEPASQGVMHLTPSSLQALHIAAHLDAIESIFLPILRNGGTVVLDRFWWSTWVYGITSHIPAALLESLIAAERAAWAGVLPTAVFLVTQDGPLRTADDPYLSALNVAYEQLAVTESESYPVHMIQNQGTIEDAVSQVLAILAPSWVPNV